MVFGSEINSRKFGSPGPNVAVNPIVNLESITLRSGMRAFFAFEFHVLHRLVLLFSPLTELNAPSEVIKFEIQQFEYVSSASL